MSENYWQKQTPGKALFPNVAWSKPEQRSQAGRVGIIGGNKLGFTAVAEAYSQTLTAGVGYAKALLPDSLKKSIPPVMTDVAFGESNPSGSLAKGALGEMRALGAWASGILLIGDAGRNSETAIVYEEFLGYYDGPLLICRDAVDLIIPSAHLILDNPQAICIASFAQLQKIFRSVYYPKMIAFSMPLALFVETLHKFSLTYPATIVTYHADQVVIASGGKVITTTIDSPMSLWRGAAASKMMAYFIWNPGRPIEAATTSFVE